MTQRRSSMKATSGSPPPGWEAPLGVVEPRDGSARTLPSQSHSRPPRLSTISPIREHHALVERLVAAPAGENLYEPQATPPIVVAVIEEVLVDQDLDPGPQLTGEQQGDSTTPAPNRKRSGSTAPHSPP